MKVLSLVTAVVAILFVVELQETEAGECVSKFMYLKTCGRKDEAMPEFCKDTYACDYYARKVWRKSDKKPLSLRYPIKCKKAEECKYPGRKCGLKPCQCRTKFCWNENSLYWFRCPCGCICAKPAFSGPFLKWAS